MTSETNMNAKENSDNQIDGLTGCRSKYGLEFDLTLAVMDAGRSSEKRYRNSFLCIDIDNFMRFLDYRGYGPSDQVLIAIAERLRLSYSTNQIY
jgi:GGDEF domain-containing protein